MSKTHEFDIIVIGSGIAGLSAALKAASFARIGLFTKDAINASNTWVAQGGIAAAIGKEDSIEEHLQDTLKAGAELCDREAVSVLVQEGPERIRELIELGTPFDRVDNHIALAREGAHSKQRILHAGGDATGHFIQQTLQDHVKEKSNIHIYEQTLVTDLLVWDEKIHGIRTLNGDIFRAGVVVLATGGFGQVFSRSTNPAVATGDGLAIAYRAGAVVTDMEFVQFHPTVFRGKSEKETFLFSEALRGEGAYLRNLKGERFMLDYHPLEELAPRDVVARAIVDQMHDTEYVYLDITHKSDFFLRERFPTIYNMAKERGYDISKDYLPVSPAAHYAMGGVKTDLSGRTTIEGLYACGEVASNGVHGANRLASNSLLDALVFADRAVRDIQKRLSVPSELQVGFKPKLILQKKTLESVREELREIMFRKVGVIRSQESLEEAERFIREHKSLLDRSAGSRAVFELQNLFTVSELIVRSALIRKESRGAHFRSDYPQTRTEWAFRVEYSNKGDHNSASTII